MTHSELVKRAEKWLRNSLGCSVVLAERKNGWTGEEPDAMGFKYAMAHVVECKVSTTDLRRERQKLWRNHPAMGIGVERWYMIPPEMQQYTLDFIESTAGEKHADLSKWGVLVAHPRKIVVAKKSEQFHEHDQRSAIGHLCSELLRYQRAGIVVDLFGEQCDGSGI